MFRIIKIVVKSEDVSGNSSELWNYENFHFALYFPSCKIFFILEMSHWRNKWHGVPLYLREIHEEHSYKFVLHSRGNACNGSDSLAFAIPFGNTVILGANHRCRNFGWVFSLSFALFDRWLSDWVPQRQKRHLTTLWIFLHKMGENPAYSLKVLSGWKMNFGMARHQWEYFQSFLLVTAIAMHKQSANTTICNFLWYRNRMESLFHQMNSLQYESKPSLHMERGKWW